MENYQDIWNDVCFKFNKKINASEEIMQTTIEEAFLEKLGWSEQKGNFKSKISIPIGSKQHLIPDIVLIDNDEKFLAIEIKKGMLEFSEQHEKQLRSYMLQLKLQFGILIIKNWFCFMII